MALRKLVVRLILCMYLVLGSLYLMKDLEEINHVYGRSIKDTVKTLPVSDYNEPYFFGSN